MILNRQQRIRLAVRPLEAFLRRVERELGVKNASVTVCLVRDVEIARMNEKYRKKKGPTDILSFPAGKQWRVASAERRPTEKRNREESKAHAGTYRRKKNVAVRSTEQDSYLGDVAIAPETARRYAKKNGRSLDRELRVLILHGVLHLLGYDHETDRGEMDRFEQKLRRRFRLV